jgi:hypothetical protein
LQEARCEVVVSSISPQGKPVQQSKLAKNNNQRFFRFASPISTILVDRTGAGSSFSPVLVHRERSSRFWIPLKHQQRQSFVWCIYQRLRAYVSGAHRYLKSRPV